ncbi:hypothetical protein ACP70R_017703 [Stipagrostis hirtigluma subsp. patula]
MDRREGGKKRARGEEEEAAAAAAGRRRIGQAADAMVEVKLEEVAADEGGREGAAPWQRPPGVFEFPWQKCRGGLGVVAGGGGWELRDVFFRSLVDGRVAAIGVPGDRLAPPPRKRALFDDVDAWLAAAGDGEVDPLWRSVLEGPRPAA